MDTVISPQSAQLELEPGTPIVPVILSGGSGSRLWPISRDGLPKQLWPLISDRSMLQETALRARGSGFTPPIVICNEQHRFLIAEQLLEIGAANAQIVLEPVSRNSAPAVALACLLVSAHDPDAVVWMMAADANIADPEALLDALSNAAEAARAGHIVLFGMEPNRPETGYGYIEPGAALDAIPGVFHVHRFKEKPDLAEAGRLAGDGLHLWNSGMFVFTAATMLAEFEIHAPAILAAVRAAHARGKTDLDFFRLDPEAFTACPSISLDHAVIEHTQKAAVIPACVGWSDVGSWRALWELGPRNAEGNVAIGDVLLEGAEDCYVRSDGMLTAVVGLKEAVVVTTEDAVLVLHRDRAQDVRRIVDRLRAQGRGEVASHNRIYRPWGFYESLIAGDRFQVKRIVVKPGQKLSLQKHFHRAEHWVVVAGTALVERDCERSMIRENESIYLPLGCVHRLKNPGRIPLTLIEVQSGSYLGEDDIVRLQDTYGRA